MDIGALASAVRISVAIRRTPRRSQGGTTAEWHELVRRLATRVHCKL